MTETIWSAKPKYLLSGLLQKVFSNSCPRRDQGLLVQVVGKLTGTDCEVFVYLFLNRAVNLGMDFLKIRYWIFCPLLDLFQGTQLEQMIYHRKDLWWKKIIQCRQY